ncbi:AAA family ATPase [Lacunimicrobium album]
MSTVSPHPSDIRDPEQLSAVIKQQYGYYEQIKKELSHVIVGMDSVIEELVIGILCKGHCILQGMPGLAKTMLISKLAGLMELNFSRIQFTPDLMPTDITGGEVLEEDKTTGKRVFRFIQGPIFSNFLLADEVNRTPPKSQSALLEAMEERQLSVAGKTYQLPDPFFVLATQNPIEVEGTYPLPEAQLDRFIMKIHVKYPSREAEHEICRRQTTNYRYQVKPIINSEILHTMQALVRQVIVADHVYSYAIDLVRMSRPGEGLMPAELKDVIQYGGGPRASIALIMAAKARALLHQRHHATTGDIEAVAFPVLRHRIIPTFNAEAKGFDPDHIIAALLKNARKQSN